MPNFTLRADAVYEIRSTYRLLNDVNCVYTAYYRPQTVMQAGTTSQQFLVAYRTAYNAAILPIQVTDVTTLTHRVVELSLPGGVRSRYDEIFSTSQGEVDDEQLPPQDAFVVTRTTPLVGVRNRGRAFWAGLPEGWQVGGLWLYTDNAIAAKLNAAAGFCWQGLTVNTVANALLPILPGRTFNPVTQEWFLDPVTITGAIGREIVRSQRRREVGRGM